MWRVRFGALLAAWVTMVFGSSAVLAIAGRGGAAHFAAGERVSLPRAIWEVADNVEPVAKIALILVFAVLRLGASRAFTPARASWSYTVSIAIGAFTIISVLALLPTDLSRGFGVGLTGTRFSSSTFPVYLGAGMAAGAVFTYVQRRRTQRCDSDITGAHL